MKEVRTLAEFDIHLGEGGLDDGARSRDLAPNYRNTERRMRAAPASETNQQEWPMLFRPLPVDRVQLLRAQRGLHGREVSRPHEDDVLNASGDAVAHRQIGPQNRG